MPGIKKTIPETRSPLLLLRRIRDVMANGTVQERLDRLVKVIAEDFDCDVCSIYLMRAGDILELFASQGLKQSSVHLTRLTVGEGLVGEIAAIASPLNLADAKSHPKFAYRPETGEEIFGSFAGVPLLNDNRVLGVLVVQSKDNTTFSEEQVEVLQTIAMVLAELTLSGKLVSLKELKASSSSVLESQHFTGLPLSPGLARAGAVLHRPRFEIKKIVAEDLPYEMKRFELAIEQLQSSVDALIHSSSNDNDEQREIMESYRMFAHDKGWIKQIEEAIGGGGLTAEAAVKKVQEQLHARMNLVSSEYIRDRMQDLEDLSNRLLLILSGKGEGLAVAKLPNRFILIAKSLGPAELLDYAQKQLLGIVLEEGSSASHIVILAKAMDIPVVGKIPGITQLIQSGERVIVDGDSGEVYLRPTDDIDRDVSEHIRLRQERTQAYIATQHLPSVTLDNERVSLNINVGLSLDLRQLQAEDVDGIGLYRTELPYLMASNFPDVEAQTQIYRRALDEAQGKRVIFRSFDIGGDKQVPYLHAEKEENPAMGWRATRIGLDRPAILLHQFRSLIYAAAGRQLNVMFPFIADVAEFAATRVLLGKELRRAKAEKRELPTEIRVGTMIEIPSLLFQLPALLSRLDFVSIGSNDLLQFLFACDRGTGRLVDRYDPLSPVVLRIIRSVVQECAKAKVDVGFCGEMAGRPLEAMALIGAGVRQLSMAPSSVGPVKAMVRTVEMERLMQYVNYLCDLPDHSVRNKLVEFARDHQVNIDS